MKSQSPQSLELIYGLHPVIELLTAKRRQIRTLYTTKPEPKNFSHIKALLPAHIPVQYRSRQELTHLVGTTDHQGIVVWATPLPIRKKPFSPSTHKVLVMLDGIQDTRNMGAIIRSAYCTGINGIIITTKSSAPINASTLKASAGLAEHIDIYQVPSAKHGILELQKLGYNIYIAALAKNAHNAANVTFQAPLCIVIGSEEAGVSSDILNKGTLVMLPQKRPNLSYNASVAAGILLFLIAEQQKLLS